MFNHKKIILGITGSIAAYKSVMLLRVLKGLNADVQVIMTEAAKTFVTPLTFSTLSERPVLSAFSHAETGEWNNHVDLGLWADLILIAPCSARSLSKLAIGDADSLLGTIYLSAKCPVFIAPAMDLDMYKHPTTTDNLSALANHGCHIIEATDGALASGLQGKGRMEEPEAIVAQLKSFFQIKNQLNGQKWLVTAGPTQESIDPVRFIGNHSSGKMGYALALVLAERGALVTLVSGPVSLPMEHPNVKIIHIKSAIEMHHECIKHYPQMDGGVMCAAVADYRPKYQAKEKLKRSQQSIQIELEANPDIAAELGQLKKQKQLLFGFALESDAGIDEAKRKMEKKNFDFIVLNSLQNKVVEFGGDTHQISIIGNKTLNYEPKSKREVAKDIVNYMVDNFIQS